MRALYVVRELYVVLLRGISKRVELLYRAIACTYSEFLEVMGGHDFRCCLHVTSPSLTRLICMDIFMCCFEAHSYCKVCF